MKATITCPQGGEDQQSVGFEGLVSLTCRRCGGAIFTQTMSGGAPDLTEPPHTVTLAADGGGKT